MLARCWITRPCPQRSLQAQKIEDLPLMIAILLKRECFLLHLAGAYDYGCTQPTTPSKPAVAAAAVTGLAGTVTVDGGW